MPRMAALECGFTQAAPLGMGSKGLRAAGGKGVGVQLNRNIQLGKLGPLNLEISVSDTLDMDGNVTDSQVALNTVHEEGGEDEFSCEPDIRSARIPATPASVAVARDAFYQQFLNGRKSIDQGGSVTSSTPPRLTYTPTFIRAPTLLRTADFTRAPSIRLGTSPSLRPSATLMRIQSMALGRSTSMRSTQHTHTTSVPGLTLPGVVGVAAALQHWWQGKQGDLAAHVHAHAETAQALGTKLKEVGGAVSSNLGTLTTATAVLETLADTLHASGQSELASVHAVLHAVVAGGSALSAVGGTMHAVGQLAAAHVQTGMEQSAVQAQAMHAALHGGDAFNSLDDAVEAADNVAQVASGHEVHSLVHKAVMAANGQLELSDRDYANMTQMLHGIAKQFAT